MKSFIRNYRLLFKAQLKRIETWLSVAMILAVTGIFASMNLPDSDNLTVMVYCDDGKFLGDFVKLLEDSDSIYFFKQASSEEELKSAVTSGKAECGFVISEDYEQSFKKQKQKDVVTYYCSSFTTKGEVAKETVYLALFKVQSEIYLENNMDELYVNPSKDISGALSDTQRMYLEGDSLFRIEECYIETDREQTDVDSLLQGNVSGKTYPVSGTVAMILFVLIYLVVGDSRTKEKSGYALILNSRERMGFAFERTLAAVTIPAIIGLITMFLFNERSAGRVFLLLILLIVYGFLFCYFLSSFWKKDGSYFSGIIVLVLFSAVLCPVYIDFSIYAPVLKYICRILPVGLFLI